MGSAASSWKFTGPSHKGDSVGAQMGRQRHVEEQATEYTGLTGEFVKAPLNFMRKHAMSPPNDFGFVKKGSSKAFSTGWNDIGQTLGAAPAARWTGDVTRKAGGGVFDVEIVPHPDPQFPSAVTVRVNPRLDANEMPNPNLFGGGFLPVHWVPWQSGNIIQYRIPEVPSSEVDPSHSTYPPFFFTAGINGCSVFAHGAPTSPVISHAGSSLSVGADAGDFWRKQMVDTNSAFASAKVKGEVSKDEYMYCNLKAEDQTLVLEYQSWLTGPNPGLFEVSCVSPFGCVFGIRYGRYWTLYLQKNALFQTLAFHKESDVTSDGKLKSTGQSAKFEAARSVFEKIGPIKTSKYKHKVYSTTSLVTLPMEIVEIYPNRGYVANLKETFKKTRRT